MGSLVAQQSGNVIHLKAHHSFGRLVYSVNTEVNQSEISRIHAVIEWAIDTWRLTDLSKNGTWLNGKQLAKDDSYALAMGDEIHLGSSQGVAFTLQDIDPPSDMLISLDNPSQSIALNSYHILPNEDKPECVIHMDGASYQWCYLSFNDKDNAKQLLAENDVVWFDNQQWQLSINTTTEQTQDLQEQSWPWDALNFEYHLSLDEEYTQLFVHTPRGKIELEARTHHYLTLHLARLKAQQLSLGLHESELGWIAADQLAKELGLAETHLNIQIHRARKQFADAFKDKVKVDEFIQRRGGKVRIGVTLFQIFKGDDLETECAKHDGEFVTQ